MSGEPTTVLSVWEPFVDVMARTGLGVGPGVVDFEALDKAYEESARERAAEGAQRAARAGLNAQPRSRPRHATLAATTLGGGRGGSKRDRARLAWADRGQVAAAR